MPCLIYWPAPVQKSAHYRNMSVWQMDSNAQICANCQTATTSHPSQTVKKADEDEDEDENELDSDERYYNH